MKKKILLIVFASFMIMGVVSAASLWGSYKGNQIIRLTADGVPVKVSDAPAISMDGRTMIPIYLLKQAGINYTWDQKNQTVNVLKPVVKKNDRFSNGAGLVDLNNWAYVASYYSELDSFSSDFYIILGSFNFLSSLILNNASDNTVKDTFNNLKESIESLSDDFFYLSDGNSESIKKAYTYMNQSMAKPNQVIQGYDQAIDELIESHTLLFNYYYKGRSDSDLSAYFDIYESASLKVADSKRISNEQFNYWISGIIQQQK